MRTPPWAWVSTGVLIDFLAKKRKHLHSEEKRGIMLLCFGPEKADPIRAANPVSAEGIMVKAIVGANWGDEGKGKITDMLAEKSDVVIRYQGGANAGHTIING